ILAKEMQAFRVKITTTGNETFEAWRERDHDDLVLAVALAAWLGERIGQQTPSPEEDKGRPGGNSYYWSRLSGDCYDMRDWSRIGPSVRVHSNGHIGAGARRAASQLALRHTPLEALAIGCVLPANRR